MKTRNRQERILACVVGDVRIAVVMSVGRPQPDRCCKWNNDRHQLKAVMTFPGSASLSPGQYVRKHAGDSFILNISCPWSRWVHVVDNLSIINDDVM